jgi:hypothetical protein
VSDVVSVDTPPAPPAKGRRRRITRLTGALVGVIATVVAVVVWHVSTDGTEVTQSRVPASWARPVVAADRLGEASGVEITRVAVTGGGGLVDLRFKIVDPDRANALHDQRTPPAVVDEQTGLVVHDLLMNHAHSGTYKTGVTYYLVFNNPGNWVRRGARVTVLLGDAQVEHVKVS